MRGLALAHQSLLVGVTRLRERVDALEKVLMHEADRLKLQVGALERSAKTGCALSSTKTCACYRCEDHVGLGYGSVGLEHLDG